MKHIYLLLVVPLFFAISDVSGQSFSFHGGFSPLYTIGTHFSVKADIVNSNKWVYAINYSLLKYTSVNISISKRVGLHQVNETDKTLIDFLEFNRGYPIQDQEVDKRPENLVHRLSLFGGYKLVDNKDFIVKIYGGPHFTMDRTILSNLTADISQITINEGDNPQPIRYTDFQVYRSWDVGFGGRAEAEYKLFQNVSIGVSSQMYYDLLLGFKALVFSGGVTYHFSQTN